MPIVMRNAAFGGDSLIMTSRGYKKISTLDETSKDIWTLPWNRCDIRKIEFPTQMYHVELSNGEIINCSSDTEFIIIQDGAKKFKFVRDIYIGMECQSMATMPIIRTNGYDIIDITDHEPPMIANLNLQLHWLSLNIDKDDTKDKIGCMQITSDDVDWLRQIQLMSHGLGMMPFITESPRGFHLRFTSKDVRMFILALKAPVNKKISDYCLVERHPITIKSIYKMDGLYDIYSLCFD